MSHLTPEDEALLARARGGDAATPRDHARVKRKLLLQIGVGLGVGTSAGTAAGGAVAGATTGATVVGKVIAAVAVVATLGGGAAAVHHWRTAPARVAATATATGTGAGAGTAALPMVNPPAAMPTAVLPPVPTATATETAAATETATTTLAPPAAPAPPLVQPRNPVVARRDPESTPIVREWTDVPTATPTATATATATAIADPAQPSGPATLDAEADLLRRADAARKSGDAAGALALLEQHRARYPNGVLVEEREAERIVVLCALGRVDEARAAGARFLRDHPRSPMAARVRASCAGG